MGIGAVAEILEDVLLGGERRLADPVGAFAAHVRDGRGVARPAWTAPCRGSRCRPSRGCLRALGRGVVRAARAEERRPRDLSAAGAAAARSNASSRARRSSNAGLSAPRRSAARQRRAPPWSASARHRSAAAPRRSRRACRRCSAGATHRRCRGCASSWSSMKPRFSSTTSTSCRPCAKRQRALRLQRPGQADLVDADAERCGVAVGDAELGQRLPHIEIGLAGRNDAEPRPRRIEHDAVEAVGAREGLRPPPLRAVQPPLLLEPVHRRIAASGCSGRPAASRNRAGMDDRDALRIDVDRGRALDRLAGRLEADPAAGKARQREAEEAEIEILLHVAGLSTGIIAASNTCSL